MSGTVINHVRSGFYMDSVALMRLSRSIVGLDGVEDAALMMGTPANREILENAGLLSAEGTAAAPGDLIIAVRAANQTACEDALAAADRLLTRPARQAADGAIWRPRTLRAAVKANPAADLALISVPGDFAAAEARKALRRGLHVMVFSDNVAIEDEIALKTEARERGLLMMGPDCGTAILNGIPIAFANNVRPGGIGIVGASGTGIQEVSSLISRRGGGISHAIGVGGRDLKAEVGGISTLMAMDALDQDPTTDHMVVISKPPAAAVAAAVVERAERCGKPVTICFIGDEARPNGDHVTYTNTLKGAAEAARGGKAFGFFSFVAPPLPRQLAAARPSGSSRSLPRRCHRGAIVSGGFIPAGLWPPKRKSYFYRVMRRWRQMHPYRARHPYPTQPMRMSFSISATMPIPKDDRIP
jgi:succinyl-CoA synthetase alpha subunit